MTANACQWAESASQTDIVGVLPLVTATRKRKPACRPTRLVTNITIRALTVAGWQFLGKHDTGLPATG